MEQYEVNTSNHFECQVFAQAESVTLFTLTEVA